MSDVEMKAGGRWIQVHVSKPRKKIHLRFRNYAPLREEIKCMKGAEWRHDEGEWAVTDCHRNRLQLELLKGNTPPEFERYWAPVDHYGVSRDCLYEHQQDMVNFLLTRRRCVLAAEMRTGKTLATIEAMEHVGGDWLYVAPAKVLAAIELEFEKWGAKVKPRFLSYARLHRVMEEWDGPAPRGVVFDESSRLKTPTAQRTKAAQYLANAIREEHDGYVFLLTGTPAPKSPCDWWSQAEITCPGYLRECSVSHLERRCAILERQTFGDQTFATVTGWKEDEVELLGRRLRGLVQVYKLEDCRELPPIRHEVIDLPVSETTARAARLLASQAETAIEALSCLRQLSDGFQYTDHEALKTTTPKDGALRDLLAQHEESGRIIVYAGFHASVDRCVDICRAAGWEVLKCDGRSWEAPDGHDVKSALREMDYTQPKTIDRLAFVGHPGSGGMGLTLSAAPGIVFYSQDFNGESRRQAKARATGNPSVTIYDLIHLETDRKVLDSHERKEQLEAITLEEIRNLL